MKYKVTIKRRVLKTVETMPMRDQDRLALLIRDLTALARFNQGGPTTANWPHLRTIAT